jgi:hypothetical protein
MGILEQATQRLWVLSLACHPERYPGLEGANFAALEVIARGVPRGEGASEGRT